MRPLYFLYFLIFPYIIYSQTFPSFQKIKTDLIANKIMEKADIGYLEQTEYPWELGIVKLYNRKTQDSVIPDYFNKASRILKYNLPPRFSMNECTIIVVYVKTKPNDGWKYYTTVSEGCPKGSIHTYNLSEQVSNVDHSLKVAFITSFTSKPSEWAEIMNLEGIDKNSINITESFGKEMLTYSIEYTLFYSNNGKYQNKKYISLARLFNDRFSPKGDVLIKDGQTFNELPASIHRIKQ